MYTWNLSAKEQFYDKLRLAKKMLSQCHHGHGHGYYAEVALQSVVDHTITRIIEAHPKSFPTHIENYNKAQLTATYRWGYDGNSGHSTYRQTFDDFDENVIDQYLFPIFMVPLIVQKGPTVSWKNNRPSPNGYCRPIKI